MNHSLVVHRRVIPSSPTPSTSNIVRVTKPRPSSAGESSAGHRCKEPHIKRTLEFLECVRLKIEIRTLKTWRNEAMSETEQYLVNAEIAAKEAELNQNILFLHMKHGELPGGCPDCYKSVQKYIAASCGYVN